MNSWSLHSHPVLLLRLKDKVSLSQYSRERRHSQETKGKKQKLPRAASKPPDIITYILHPRSGLLIVYWIQPLIFKSLMFSWPVSALSTHQLFFPLFQSQPSIKSPVSACPEPGEEPPCWGKASVESFLYKLQAKRARPQRGSTKLYWKQEGTEQG